MGWLARWDRHNQRRLEEVNDLARQTREPTRLERLTESYYVLKATVVAIGLGIGVLVLLGLGVAWMVRQI
jgi:hypothetical protein